MSNIEKQQRRPLTQWFRETFKLSQTNYPYGKPSNMIENFPWDIMKGPPDPDWGRGYPEANDPVGDPDTDQGRPQKIIVHTDRIGSSGTISFTGYPTEDYLAVMKGKAKASIFDQMRRSDPQVKMCLNAVKNPIRAADWSINPAEDNDEEKNIAGLVEHVLLNQMDRPFGKFISEALTCIEFGHSVFEITNKVVENDPLYGTFIGIKDLGWRSPKTIERWNLDPQTDRLQSIMQLAYGDTSRFVTIPGDFLLVFSMEKEGSNYEGISMLRPCYGAWYRKDLYHKLNAIGIEKFAIPTPIGTIPTGQQNSDQMDHFIQALEDYTTHEQAYLTLPEGWKLDLKTNAYDPQKVEGSIDNEDKRMVKAFLANFLELGISTSGGSRALSEDLSAFFLGGIEYIAKEICDEVNLTLIPLIVKQNFGERAKYPTIKASGISDRMGQEFGNLLKALADAQYITPDDELEELLRKRLKFPKMSLQGQRAVLSKGSLGTTGPANPQDPTAAPTLSEKIKMAEDRRKKKIKESAT